MAIDQYGVIEEFLRHRNKTLATDFRIVKRPDQIDRNEKEVDAICTASAAHPLAIEVTQIETYRNQLRDGQWFTEFVYPIETELAHRYDPWWVGISFVYWRGRKWRRDAVEVLCAWLDENLKSVPEQESRAGVHEYEIAPLGLARVSKHEGSGRPGIYISRTVPTNVETPSEILGIMQKALDHKRDVLASYSESGHISVLLLDTRDIALTNHIEQYKAFLRVCRQDPRKGLNEVWLAMVFEGTRECYVSFLCFRADLDLMKRANPAGLMLTPEHDDFWNSVIEEEDAEDVS